ncbi:MAG: metal-dependent hydrolase, partial [Desulfobacterales bacterium]|nr:metal-dependent hydrolase [Desulfobacterales bacterium]
MKIIDPHIHMVSRTTDDYLALALSGIHTVSEPAFWAGFDKKSAAAFHDYFEHISAVEPVRAARFGIKHYCWIGLNSKEAEDLQLAAAVVDMIPGYLDRPTVLGLGEIGLNKNSRNEIQVLEKQLAIAAERDELVLIHTPHLEDKLKGTRIIMDLIRNEPRIRP